jgi:hypothetical protein
LAGVCASLTGAMLERRVVGFVAPLAAGAIEVRRDDEAAAITRETLSSCTA